MSLKSSCKRNGQQKKGGCGHVGPARAARREEGRDAKKEEKRTTVENEKGSAAIQEVVAQCARTHAAETLRDLRALEDSKTEACLQRTLAVYAPGYFESGE